MKSKYKTMFGDNRDKIVINENAYFYKKKKRITNTSVSNIFKSVSVDKINGYLLKKENQFTTIKRKKIKYSICVFKTSRKPTFIIESIEKWLEIRLSYLLIIEIDDYVIISKKNISKLNEFLELLEPIDYSILSTLFINSSTAFESLSLQNSNISDSALRRKNVSSVDLQDSLSTLGASSYLIQNLRLKDDNERVTLSLSTSRINKMGAKKGLKVLFEWCINLCKKINTHIPTESYISSFAAPINFKKQASTLKPRAILIDINHLLINLNNGTINRCYIEKNGAQKEVDIKGFADTFNKLKEVKLDKVSSKFLVDNKTANDLRININSNSITLGSKKLKSVIVEYNDGSHKTMTEYLNERNDFIINFEDIEMVYTKRKLFKDHKLLNNIPHFLKIFEPRIDLKKTTTEKGKPNKKSTKFPKESVFDVVEKQYKNNFDYFICDDTSNEWADHIGVKDDLVAFYHSKSKTSKFAASDFQDVIGQAQKNYGNLTPTDKQFEKKEETWGKYFNSNTKIKLLRKGKSVKKAIDLWKENISSPNFKRQVNIVVDFISKSELEKRLNKLTKGEDFREKNEVIQILWFISSLIGASLELGIETKVICKP